MMSRRMTLVRTTIAVFVVGGGSIDGDGGCEADELEEGESGVLPSSRGMGPKKELVEMATTSGERNRGREGDKGRRGGRRYL